MAKLNKDEFIKRLLFNCGNDDTCIPFFIGLRIYEALEQRDIQAKELAEQADISVSTLLNIMYAKTISSIINICKIADALNVSVDWIVGWKG